MTKNLQFKNFIIAIFIFVLFSHSTLLAQQTNPIMKSIALNNVKMSVAINNISKIFGVDILFNHEELDKYPNVTIKEKGITLKKAIESCVKGTNLEVLDNKGILIIRPKAVNKKAEDKQFEISGVVYDNEGSILPGATIVVKNTYKGTITDENGCYKLNVKSSDNIIEANFVGHESLYKVLSSDKVKYDFVLQKEDLKVDDVVVLGYGEVDKKSFTGTSVKITKEELFRASPNNILQSISLFDPSFRMETDNISGSDPNKTNNFYIRGRSGIGNTQLDANNISETELKNNPNLPTFILDGYEVDIQKVYDLDPSRVESITILKDAASTAIYGSRAANGVMVIETVSPKAGKLNVRYSFNASLSTPDLSDYDLLNAAEKLELERIAGFFDPKPTDLPSAVVSKQETYYKKLTEVNKGVDTYWLSQPLRTAFSHKHNLNISGGNDAFKYGITTKLDMTSGVMKESDVTRKSIEVSISYRLKKLMFSNNIEWSNNQGNNTIYGSFNEYAIKNQYEAIRDDNGNYLKNLSEWNSPSMRINPLYDATLNSYDKYVSNDLTNNFNIKWFILDGLRVEGRVALRYGNKDSNRFMDPLDSGFSNLSDINLRGSFDNSNEARNGWDANAFISYNKTFNKSHISVVLGGNMKESNISSSSYSLVGYAAGNISDQNFAIDVKGKPKGGSSITRLVGAFLQLNYTYNNIYLFDFSSRYEGGSQFGKNNKFAPFWSLGFGVNVDNYKFVKENIKWISGLKIRATYGKIGSANFNQNIAKKIYVFDTNNIYVDGFGATMRTLGNPDLKWSNTGNLDLGVDLNILNRYSASITYYNKNTSDGISSITIPASTGFTSFQSNLGTVINSGIELSLRANVIKTKNTHLSIYGTMANNKNKLTKISNAMKSYNKLVEDMYNNNKGNTYTYLRYYEGSSMTSIYAMPSLGIDPANGKEIFLNRDGSRSYIWDPSQHVICGDTEPKMSGSFGFNFDYKGFFTFVGFTYEYGGQLDNRTLYNKVENANLYGNVDRRVLTDRWQKPGDDAMFRNIKDWNSGSPTRATSRFVQDNDMLKFNSVTLGYNVPFETVKKMKLSSVKFQISMNDIGQLSSIKMERGTSYPFARTFNFSISVGL